MTNPKFHLSLNVKNVEDSVRFYSILFNTQPTKLKAGYAKFDLEQPAVNLTLNESAPCCITGISHMGVRVDSTAQVLAAKQRLEVAGLGIFEETNTTCCYAVQDKIWATDPTGYRWEIYVFKSDSEDAASATHDETQSAAQGACCTEQATLNGAAKAQNQAPQACCSK
jgi:hypothetical protein